MEKTQENVERVLVQGSATFSISCNELKALVTPEQAKDEAFMEGWFINQAYKMLINGGSHDSEATYENDVPVLLYEETAQSFTGKIVTDAQWKAIREESQENKSKSE
ncbi:hypothetical protein [Paenibacillus bovis]|uniref:Uncharacterized protein n=1 Tax=Paenibacillus bovis TaxID=1616788 RepID=A0A1X9T3X2_9BACL|nr:hypothetical protein [Paenibacillus bovis]ARR10670.1 hypothetical protein AR543_p0062 [Paenibacillus bovis]